MPKSGPAAKSPAPPAPASLGGGRKAIWLAGSVLLLATMAVYSNSFSVPFTFDDTGAIRDNPTIERLWPPWQALSPPGGLTVGGRPVLNLSFALNHALGGTGVTGYHALNLAIHILAGLILFGVIRRTLIRVGRVIPNPPHPTSTASNRRVMDGAPCVIAFAVALLWMLHPLQTESVTYLSQRAESLMGMFYLLTLYCFIRGVEGTVGAALRRDDNTASSGSGHKAPPTSRKRPGLSSRTWYAFSIVACLLGMGTKEVMVSAPLMVLLYDRTFVSGTFRTAWRERRTLYLGLVATWIPLALFVAGTAGRGGTAGFGGGVSGWTYALTQSQAVSRYLWLAFWPHPLVFDYGTAVVTQPAAALPFAAILLVLAAATLVALWRRPGLGFAGAWFFVILAPSSSIVPVATQTMAEHRMYLPLAAVSMLWVCGLHALLRRSALTLILTFILTPPLGWLTFHRNNDYRSSQAIWSDTVAKCPDNARAHSNLGFALFEAGRIPDAIAHLQRALQLQPDFAEVHNNLGNALIADGRADEAIPHFEAAFRLHFSPAEVYQNLGSALASAGRLEEAVVQYRVGLRLNPGFAEAHNNLGIALARLQRLREAATEFQEAVRLDPNNGQAWSNLGNVLLQLGRTSEAIAQYEESLRHLPDSVETHFNLGNALVRAGRIPEAQVQFEKVLELRPDFAPAQTMLARLRRIEQTASPPE